MAELITRETTVRDALARYPGAEPIFDRHGLSGCGGPTGPLEPIGFFAAIHHVDANVLLGELNAYAAAAEGEPAPPKPPAPPQPYRPFITTALLFAIGGGITSGIAAAITGRWGGLRGEAWIALVQSHGHLQVFGFVALLVMGVAFHILPRFKGQIPPAAWLPRATYALMTSGVLARVLTQPHAQGWLRPFFAASAVLEVAAALLFGWFIARTLLRARGKREPFDVFVLAGTTWLITMTAINAVLVFEAVGDRARLLAPAGDQALLIGAAQGFVVLFVGGIAVRALPFFAALRQPRARLRDAAVAVLAVAVPVRVAATWWPAFDANGWSADAGRAAALAAAAAIACLPFAIRIWERPASQELPAGTPPGFRVMARAAFAWLLAAAVLDAYWQLREIEGGFTPMYAAGAVRHAYIAGFATSMLFAMAYRILPVFSGRALRWPQYVPLSFVALTAGLVLRTAPVALTPTPSGLDFQLMAAGGVLVLVAASILALELASTMFEALAIPRQVAAAAVEAPAPQPAPVASPPAPPPVSEPAPGPPIYANMTVAEALAVSPIVLQVLLDYGFGPLADPAMRARMASTVTIQQAAGFLGTGVEPLLETLNAAVSEGARADGDQAAGAGVLVRVIDAPVTEAEVLRALTTVTDPEVPVNIVDLGLVYETVVRDGYAHVVMTLTSPQCPLGDAVERDVQQALRALPGIEAVDVDIVHEPAWDPKRMTGAARAALGWA